jgi:hypothetical protein
MIDAISGEIARYSGETPGAVTEYVVLAAFVGADGEAKIWSDTAEGQQCHQTLGLLAYATAIESARAADADVEDEGEH